MDDAKQGDRHHRILVVDDEPNLAKVVRIHLERAGYHVTTCSSGEAAWSVVQETDFQCILTDLVMPDGDGFWLLNQLSALNDMPVVVLMSAHADVDTALSALSRGAYDYLAKPFRPEELLFRIRRALNQHALNAELVRLRRELSNSHVRHGMISQSELMLKVFDMIERVAPLKTTVMVTGESGTGKELIARALHESSDRVEYPFVAVNCGAIPEHLLESELFGHRRGAFTDAISDRKGLFEAADGGTLFLDEVGELSKNVQVKLLRVLQEGQVRRVGETTARAVDVRIVAATHRDLAEAVREQLFREDLYYRLNVLPIFLPPLRDRQEDVPLLLAHFLKYSRNDGEPGLRGFENAAVEVLKNYDWPGNIRELQNLVERLSITCTKERVSVDDLPSELVERVLSKRNDDFLDRETGVGSLKEKLSSVEKKFILSALSATGGNRTHAARLLKVSHRTLLYKIKTHGIE